MREEFEKLIRNLGYSSDRYPETSGWPGNYRQIQVQLAWEAWQAATALQDPRVRELEEALKYIKEKGYNIGGELCAEEAANALLSATARVSA
jgi:hypothetical protein